MFNGKSFLWLNVPTSTIMLHPWVISLGSVCYCALIPFSLQGILTCWHTRLKYIPHNPIFLANAIACLILCETAKTCFVSVVCKITFGRFHVTHCCSQKERLGKKDVCFQLWLTRGCHLVRGNVMPFAALSMELTDLLAGFQKACCSNDEEAQHNYSSYISMKRSLQVFS